MGAEMLEPARAERDDVVLAWEGEDVVAVRLPQLSDSLDHILIALERRHGMPLADLDRKAKQSVVRTLEARGAFLRVLGDPIDTATPRPLHAADARRRC